MKYLILDIEAVVDSSLWTPPEDEPDAFAPPYAWRPICIGLVLLEPTAASRIVARRVGALDEPTERDLLIRFGETVTKLQPCTIVTWNGRGFDLPVLMMRSLRFGLANPWYFRPGVRHRYSEEGHCDLKDAMADYGGARAAPLDAIARLCGLPGKPKGADEVSGKNVAAAYAAGRMPEIVAYCMADAAQTAFVWLRWCLLKGGLHLEEYHFVARELLRACEAEPRLGALAAGIDRRVLLLEEGEEEAA